MLGFLFGIYCGKKLFEGASDNKYYSFSEYSLSEEEIKTIQDAQRNFSMPSIKEQLRNAVKSLDSEKKIRNNK